MFLGGAGLADTMLYCRDKIYPLGLPNGRPCADRVRAAGQAVPQGEGELPSARPPPLNVSLRDHDQILTGRFRCLR